MNYMSQADFAPVSGIQELSFEEIEVIDGGASARDVIDYGTAGARVQTQSAS